MQDDQTQGYLGLESGAARAQWNGSEETLTDEALVIQGHPVMERWETPYMDMFARMVASGGGRILECGFGMGISANAIQRYSPDEHVIIEYNGDVFERLKRFADKADNRVTPLHGTASAIAGTLDPASFDGIFYDTYPLNAEEQHSHQFAFIREAYPLLKTGGTLTYCNLTSTGVLRGRYDSWEALFAETQVPHLLDAGVPASDIKGLLVFNVSPPPTCQYFQHPSAMIPLIVKG